MSQTSEPVSTIPVQEWVQGAEARWHLSKVVQRAARPDGSLLPVQITRFLDGCPDNLLDAVTRYLNASATYPSVMMDGKFFEGPFLSSGVTIARDPNNKNPTSAVMLIQVLRLNTAGLGEGDSAVDGVSCTEQSSTEYRYNASALEVLPPAEPGVTRNLGQVRRDEATGLYNYEIVTRTKQVQEFGEFVENSTAFETVTRSIRRNLSPVGFNMSAAVVTTPGTTIDVDADKNPDCSVNETQRKTVAKTNVTMQIVMSENALTTEDETRTSASLTIPGAVGPSGGTVTTVTAEKRKDNLHNVALRQETEKQQLIASSSAETLHQRTVETSIVDQAQRPSANRVGEQISAELTRFGNFRNVMRTVTAMARGLFEVRKSVTAYKTTQSSLSSVTGKPAELQPGVSGVGGIVRTRSLQLQDGAGNVWRVEDGVETDKSVENAAVQKSATVKEIVEEVTDTGAAVSTTDEITAATPGQTRSSKLTPSGVYENTRRIITTILGVIFERGVSDSYMRHGTSEQETAAAPVTDAVAAIGTSKVVTNTQQPNGTWEVRTQVDTEKLVETGTTKSLSLRGVVTEEARVAAAPSNVGLDSANLSQVGVTEVNARSETGQYKVQLRTPTPVARKGIIRSLQRSFFGWRESEVEYTTNALAPALVLPETTEVGVMREMTVKLGDDGTAEVTRTQVHEGSAASAGAIAVYEDAFSTRTIQVFRNQPKPPPAAALYAIGVLTTYGGVSFSDAGTYDYTKTVVTAKRDLVNLVFIGGVPSGLTPEEYGDAWLCGSRITHFRNTSEAVIDGLIADASQFLFYTANVAGYHFSAVGVTSLNEFGLYDGQIGYSFSARWN